MVEVMVSGALGVVVRRCAGQTGERLLLHVVDGGARI